MAKDPAFLFYPGDWLSGTLTFNRSHKGAYMDLLMAQHSTGHMSLEDIKTVLGPDFDEMWELKLKKKFKQDDNGLFFNQKLEEVINERSEYKTGRLENLKGKKKHMNPHMGILYEDTLCRDEDINRDEDIVNKGGKGEKEEDDNLKNQFEIFRQSYPGTKRGFNPEFENFIKKNKNWKEIVSILSDALNYQKSAREIKRRAGGFVPEWKNLQTWINQKCWEEEIEINNIGNGTKTNIGADSIGLAKLAALKFGVPQ